MLKTVNLVACMFRNINAYFKLDKSYKKIQRIKKKKIKIFKPASLSFIPKNLLNILMDQRFLRDELNHTGAHKIIIA